MARNNGGNRPGNGGGSGGGQQNRPSGGGGSAGGGRPSGGGQGNSGGGQPNRPRPASPQAIANANRPNRPTTLNRPGSAGGGAPGSRPSNRPIGLQTAIANQLQDLGFDPSMATHFGSWGEFQQWWGSWGQIDWSQNLGPDGKPVPGKPGIIGDPYDSSMEEEQVDPDVAKRRQSAFITMSEMFRQYGLDLGSLEDPNSLLSKLKGWAEDDISVENMTLMIRNEDAYKRRFPGMSTMLSRGMNEAQYVAQENAYRDALSSWSNLPRGFYDGPEDFAKWITGEVSPLEVERRVIAAGKMLDSADPSYRQALGQMGIDDSGMVAFILDPVRGQDVINRQLRTAQIIAGANRAGSTLTMDQASRISNSLAENVDALSDAGMQDISNRLAEANLRDEADRVLAAIDQENTYSFADSVEAAFGDVNKQLASKARADREKARFSGSSAVTAGSLSRRRAQ